MAFSFSLLTRCLLLIGGICVCILNNAYAFYTLEDLNLKGPVKSITLEAKRVDFNHKLDDQEYFEGINYLSYLLSPRPHKWQTDLLPYVLENHIFHPIPLTWIDAVNLEFDKKGRTIEAAALNKNHESIFIMQYEYDEKQLKKITLLDYLRSGNLTPIIWDIPTIQADETIALLVGSEEMRTELIFDNDHRLIARKIPEHTGVGYYLSPSVANITIQYIKDKKQIFYEGEHPSFDDPKRFDSHNIVMTFDSDSQFLTHIKRWGAEGEQAYEVSESYQRNQQNDLLSVEIETIGIETDEIPTAQLLEFSDYEYDDQGNWVKVRFKDDDSLFYSFEDEVNRTIEYYK